MTALTPYSTGTVTVAANGTTVTGSGTIWSGVNVKPGDILQIGNFQTVITDVTDTAHLVIPPWGGGAQAGAAYTIWQWFPQRVAGAQAMQQVSDLVGALNTSGFFFFVDVSLTNPDPSLGSDGQYAYQPTTGKMWVKASGAWTYLGIYKGMNFRGVYDNTATYSLGDVQTTAGSSYVWINSTPGSGHAAPNPTYWQLLASKGDTGQTGPLAWATTANWATGTAYVATAPASIVVGPNKNLYQCIVAHTSGTFATDLAAGKWLLIGQSLAEGTSTSSVTVGIGSQGFTTQLGLSYQNGVRLRASSNASPGNWQEGVCNYDPSTGAMLMFRDKSNGSGTFADWNFNRVGQPGAGDLSSANNLSELADKAASLTNLSGVSYGVAQTLTAAQQKQARQNIGTVNGAFSVDRNGTDQTGLTSGAYNKLTFPNKVYDAESWYDTTTNRYTPQVPGLYLFVLTVNASVASPNTANADSPQPTLYKNGAKSKAGAYIAAWITAAASLQAVAAIYMNGTTDYVEPYCYVGASITTVNGSTSNTHFSGFRIG